MWTEKAMREYKKKREQALDKQALIVSLICSGVLILGTLIILLINI